jgi:hypothetical protein
VVEQLESETHDGLPPDGPLRAGLEQDMGPSALKARLAERRRTPVGGLIGTISQGHPPDPAAATTMNDP